MNKIELAIDRDEGNVVQQIGIDIGSGCFDVLAGGHASLTGDALGGVVDINYAGCHGLFYFLSKKLGWDDIVSVFKKKCETF